MPFTTIDGIKCSTDILILNILIIKVPTINVYILRRLIRRITRGFIQYVNIMNEVK